MIKPGDLVVNRQEMGRGPLSGPIYAWRYGVAQRCRRPVGDDPVGWYGYWPSFTSRERAEETVAWYRRGAGDGYEFAVAVYPPEQSPESVRMERA